MSEMKIENLVQELREESISKGGIEFDYLAKKLLKTKSFILIPIPHGIIENDDIQCFVYTKYPAAIIIDTVNSKIKDSDIKLMDIPIEMIKGCIDDILRKYDFTVEKLTIEEYLTLFIVSELVEDLSITRDIFTNDEEDKVILTKEAKKLLEALSVSDLNGLFVENTIPSNTNTNNDDIGFIDDEDIRKFLNEGCNEYTDVKEEIDFLVSKGFVFVETASTDKYKLPDFNPGKKMNISLLVSDGKRMTIGTIIFIVSGIKSGVPVFCGCRDMKDDKKFLNRPIEFLNAYDPESDYIDDRARFYSLILNILNNESDMTKYIFDSYFKELPNSNDTEKYLVYKDKINVFVSKRKEGDKTFTAVSGIRYAMDKYVFDAEISYEDYNNLYRNILYKMNTGTSAELKDLLNIIASKMNENLFERFMIKTLDAYKNEDFELDVKSYSLGRFEVLYDRCRKDHITVLTGVDDLIANIFKGEEDKNEK